MLEQPDSQPSKDSTEPKIPPQAAAGSAQRGNDPQQAASGPRANAPTRPASIPPARPGAPETTQADLDRVREIIMGNPDRTRQPVREGEAERLRDILFGPMMEEYERRFADLRREIDRVLNDLRQARDAMDEFREAQRERIDAVERELRQSNEDLGREMDKVRSQGPALQQLIPQTRQLQSLVNGIGQEVNDVRSALTRENQDVRSLRSMIDQYRDQYERSLDTLKREKRQAEDEIKEELRRVADRLDDQKTDRKTLAAILIELATRLETGYTSGGILEAFVASPEE